MTEIAQPTAPSATPRRAASDIALQLAGRLGNIALGIVVTVVLVHALGDEGFGKWSTMLAIAQIAGYLGDLGLEQVAVRSAAEDPQRERQWIGALVSLRVLLTLPAMLLAVAVVFLVEHTNDTRIAGVLLSATLLVAGFSSIRAVYQLRIRNAVNSTVELANGIIWGAAVFALALIDAGLVAFAAAFLAAYMITTAVQVVFATRLISLKTRGTRVLWPDLVKVGLPVAVGGVLILAYGKIDQILVFELDGERGAGLYGAAFRVLDRAHLLPATVLATTFPLLAAAYAAGDRERLRRLVQTVADVLLLASMPIFAFALSADDELVVALFGDEFAPAATTLTVLIGTFVVTSLGYLAGYLVIVLRLQWRFVRFALLALVFNVVANVLLIPSYGFEAAAWINLATEVLVIGLTGIAVARTLGHGIAIGRPARIATASALMAVIVAVADHEGAPLGLLVAIALVVYPLAILGMRAIKREDIELLLRRTPSG